MAASQSPKLLVGVRVPGGMPILSLCNANLVDGLIWSQEAVGSNPTMETNLMSSQCEMHRFGSNVTELGVR